MTVNEVFLQAKDYLKILNDSNAFSSGRMGHAATEFYKLLGALKDFLLVPYNIRVDLLVFMAKVENIDSLGPLIDLIQPEEDRKAVRYHIAAALVMQIDQLATKKTKYGQLGLDDSNAYESLLRLEKSLE